MNEMNKKSKNENLRKAKNAKNDEFYTTLSEIENELLNYKDKFKDKIVFCNCDDPYESNFVKYFLMHFNGLKLKELIATGYKASPIGGIEVENGNPFIPYVLRIKSTKKYLVGDQKDLDSRSAKYYLETERNNLMTPLLDEEKFCAGDFRSEKSLKLLKEADIVVTNPPFSLFREYIELLMDYKKQFLVLGSMNAISYKEIFTFFKENQIWLGCVSGSKEYRVSDKYAEENSDKCYKKNNVLYTKFGNTSWYTNIDHEKRHQILPLDLGHTYKGHEKNYPKYDNYDAINIDKVSDIPSDYNEAMGVPISFMDKYSPEQFEIIGIAKRGAGDPKLKSKVYKKEEYKNYSDLNSGPVLNENGILKNTFPRIIIKRKVEK